MMTILTRLSRVAALALVCWIPAGAAATVDWSARQALWEGTLDAAELELRLYRNAVELRQTSGSESSRVWLQSLLDYPVHTTREQYDAGHHLLIPVYPVATAARTTLAVWAARKEVAAIDEAVRAGRFAPTLAKAANPSALARWIETATAPDLERIATSLLEANAPPAESVLAALARRLPGSTAVLSLARSAVDAASLAALKQASLSLDLSAQYQLWSVLTDNAALAGAGWSALGQLAHRHPGAAARLWQALSDPRHGTSAARALADSRLALIDELETRLRLSGNANEQRSAALALYLRGTPAARAALERYSASARTDLQQDLARWLH